jgi:hypothetical protein
VQDFLHSQKLNKKVSKGIDHSCNNLTMHPL